MDTTALQLQTNSMENIISLRNRTLTMEEENFLHGLTVY